MNEQNTPLEDIIRTLPKKEVTDETLKRIHRRVVHMHDVKPAGIPSVYWRPVAIICASLSVFVLAVNTSPLMFGEFGVRAKMHMTSAANERSELALDYLDVASEGGVSAEKQTVRAIALATSELDTLALMGEPDVYTRDECFELYLRYEESLEALMANHAADEPVYEAAKTALVEVHERIDLY
ncbi:MAG: hypothetical protein RLZZ480_920 [Candidatus Parcubacteria bacterium]|jgi:hypothetical protein